MLSDFHKYNDNRKRHAHQINNKTHNDIKRWRLGIFTHNESSKKSPHQTNSKINSHGVIIPRLAAKANQLWFRLHALETTKQFYPHLR